MKEPAKTLDLEGVGVTEQSELHLISKSSRTAEPFESELQSIIGRINFRAKELKEKLAKPEESPIDNRDSLVFS